MTMTGRRAQREELLARRMALPPSERRAKGVDITRLLLQTFAIGSGQVVGLYWPFKGEFDPRHAARAWRANGARTALPVVVAKNAPLEFREWWPGVATRPGVFDLPVPIGTAVVRPDVLLMPPVGFDARGYRLGYGGGYYDRTLAVLGDVDTAGVGYACCEILDFVPGAHDRPLQRIVTDREVLGPFSANRPVRLIRPDRH